jgi:hypothetical protein
MPPIMSHNLTIEEGLLKQHTAEPLEGHNVVVFEKVGTAGEKIHSVLPPGSPRARVGLVRTVLGKTDPFFAYAVDASPERLLTFTEHVVLADHAHEFDLVFDLAYGVADPRVVAGERNKDPLSRVRRFAGEVVVREVSQLPWDEVRFSFRLAGESVVQTELARINRFAADYGVEVLSLALEARLSQRDVELAQKHAEAERKKESFGIDARVRIAAVSAGEEVKIEERSSGHRVSQHDLGLRLAGADLEQAAAMVAGNAEMQRALVSAAVDAVKRVGGTISTPEELLAGLNAVRSIVGGGAGIGAGGIPGVGGGYGGLGNGHLPGLGNGAAGGMPALPAATPGPLSIVLAELVAATDGVRIRMQKQALRVALLHLVAEALAGDQADAAAEARHGKRARELIDALDPAPAGEALDALRRLADPEHLRGRFDN